jgi:16S rRNA processing protein RimM
MTASPGGDTAHAIVGRVRRAHGVRGELVVELLTGAPDAIFASGARLLGGTTTGDLPAKPTTLHVRGARPFKEGLLVVFDEITDRVAADLWRDRFLLVPMAELEPPDEDEVFLHDLVGLKVLMPDGAIVGDVVGYYDAPHAVLLEIRRESGTVLMPYQKEFVESVDVDAGVIHVSPPEGLFD